MSQYEKLSLLLQAVVGIAAFVTLAFLYRQLKAMVDQITATQEASRAQSAMAIVSFLQSPEARASRQCVRAVLSNRPHTEWSDEEKIHASLVCANYDVIASLLKANLAPMELFVANWGPSISHCHQVLSPYMAELRAKPGAHPAYWSSFDWLHSKVQA